MPARGASATTSGRRAANAGASMSARQRSSSARAASRPCSAALLLAALAFASTLQPAAPPSARSVACSGTPASVLSCTSSSALPRSANHDAALCASKRHVGGACRSAFQLPFNRAAGAAAHQRAGSKPCAWPCDFNCVAPLPLRSACNAPRRLAAPARACASVNSRRQPSAVRCACKPPSMRTASPSLPSSLPSSASLLCSCSVLLVGAVPSGEGRPSQRLPSVPDSVIDGARLSSRAGRSAASVRSIVAVPAFHSPWPVARPPSPGARSSKRRSVRRSR